MSDTNFSLPGNPGGDFADKLHMLNLKAEQVVLGTIILDDALLKSKREFMTPDDFCHDVHRQVFTALLDLNERGEVVDLVTLTEHLKEKGELEAVGGPAYLSSLVNSVYYAVNNRRHSGIVHEKALAKKLRWVRKVLKPSIRRCSFCDKREDQVITLINVIKGPKASICNECVDMFNEVVMETIRSRRQPRPSSPTP